MIALPKNCIPAYELSSSVVSRTWTVPVSGASAAQNHSAAICVGSLGTRLPVRTSRFPLRTVAPASGFAPNRLPTCTPPPWVTVSAATLSRTVLSRPPYTAKPLASSGTETVLRAKVLPVSAFAADHMAMPSSPVLRTNRLVTVLRLTPLCRLRPSAQTFLIRPPSMVSPSDGPSNHMPTLTCSTHTFLMVEPLSEPPKPLSTVASSRTTVSPNTAKSDRCTPVLGCGAALPNRPTPAPRRTVCHGPAPRTVTRSTWRWRVTA